jgi:oxygen-independent coproporphyrinogen-3 oxidase
MFKGLYIHIPFCNQKCPYCDFFSLTTRPVDFETYFNALVEEIKIYADAYRFSLKTVYFGGGTPSVIPPGVYEKFFHHLGKVLELSALEEVTIEVNPESYTFEDFKALKDIGFNRISVGVQSFLDKNLKLLGRKHSVRDSLRTLEEAHRAGFNNISVDLIWGLPGQSINDLKKEFKVLKQTPAVHLSAYLLTLYEETPFYLLHRQGRLKLPSQEEVELLYQTLLEETERLGFERYEISNFSKGEEFKSRHNLLYWKMEPFLGVGAGAWSFDGKRRWSNVKNLPLYVRRVLKDKTFPREELIELTPDELKKEAIILGLRTTEGIPARWIEGRLPEEVLKEFFTRKGDKIAFNPRGFLVSNAILSMLV